MDRDASTAPATPADAVPPTPPASVRATALAGLGLCAAAAALGLVAAGLGSSAPAALNTARLFLVVVGAVTAGAAISMRPDLWWAWAVAAAAAALGVPGLPAHWDSFRLLFGVLAAAGLTGAVLVAAPPRWRVAVLSVWVLFHFTGIFTAATTPPPTPWVSEQSYYRLYTPYLQFLYLRNAYHFYSPEPGPSSLLVFLLKTETGETEAVTDPVTGQAREVKKYDTKWVTLPLRPQDIRDPLGLTYFRRLSLTEQIARGAPGVQVPTDGFEKLDVYKRRHEPHILQMFPLHPIEPDALEYRLPNPDVARYLLPSYARHVILHHTAGKDEAARTTVNVYRMEHRTLSAEEYGRRLPDGSYPDPYTPSTYRPYFMGEFNARGDLVDPQEPLLYWLLPVIPLPPDPINPGKKTYLDYMSVHALGMSPNEVLAADEKAGKVFDWARVKSTAK
jgi:hypothetical protein